MTWQGREGSPWWNLFYIVPRGGIVDIPADATLETRIIVQSGCQIMSLEMLHGSAHLVPVGVHDFPQPVSRIGDILRCCTGHQRYIDDFEGIQ